MSFTFSSFQALLIPLVILFAIFGFRKGFWLEVGRTIGMGLVVLTTVIFPDFFINIINRIITRIPRVIGVLAGNPNAQPLDENLLFGDPGSLRYLIARVAIFILLAFLVYSSRFGWAYEAGKVRIAKTTGERILGAVFGGISGFLWFVALNSFLNTVRDLRGQPTLPFENTTISIPEIPDLRPLLALVPTIILILLIILLVLALLRLPRLWR